MLTIFLYSETHNKCQIELKLQSNTLKKLLNRLPFSLVVQLDHNLHSEHSPRTFTTHLVCRACKRGVQGVHRTRAQGAPERVQVSALSFGITPYHRNQTCLQQKYQSAYSVQVIGRFFGYTAFRASNSGRFD